MIKKLFALLAMAFAYVLLVSCGDTAINGNTVVCAAFPQYDVARAICGDAAEVVMLIPCGSEAHDYEPSAKDIKMISASLLFLYNGGESDAWIDRVLRSTGDINAVSLIDCCTSPIYIDGEDGVEQDEHIWTSPKNMLLMAEKTYNALVEILPEKKDTLTENYLAYKSLMLELDGMLTRLGAELGEATLIIGDRDPFAYLSRDYGIKTAAAFHGCGHDSEPSAAELKQLIEVAEAENAKTVFYVDFSTGKIARTVAEELDGAVTCRISSCHNVTDYEFKNKSYYDLMVENITLITGVCNASD